MNVCAACVLLFMLYEGNEWVSVLRYFCPLRNLQNLRNTPVLGVVEMAKFANKIPFVIQ